jgi:hypothetical protein
MATLDQEQHLCFAKFLTIAFSELCFDRFRCQGLKYFGEGLNGRADVGAEPMALRNPARVVVGKSHFAGGILVDQHLQGQIDAYDLIGLHQRCAAARVAKNEQLSRPQRHADSRRASRMIDPREHGQPLRLNLGFEPIHGLLGSVIAGDGRQSVYRHGASS